MEIYKNVYIADVLSTFLPPAVFCLPAFSLHSLSWWENYIDALVIKGPIRIPTNDDLGEKKTTVKGSQEVGESDWESVG